jgi:blue copper oxidase
MKRLALSVLALALVLLLATTGGFAWLYSRADASTVGELAFRQELKIPALLEPRVDESGRKVFALDVREGTSELILGRETETWGANGSYLGPTLRASRGDHIFMRVHNGLPETTTMHWHGMHLPAVADGGPHQMIEPGETWRPSWTIDQSAGTLWYHPHLLGETEDQVYRGVAGMFILDDPQAAALELPHRYGVDDIPVIVQDKRFEDDGELSFSEGLISPLGRLGDTILVNGTWDPHLELETTRVRLRLLNASGARVFNFGFADEREFDLIATGEGLLAAPERLNRIQLSPGERAEIVVEVKPSERVVLRSFEPELGDVDFFSARFVGADDSFDILQLRAADELTESPEVPAKLVPDDELPNANEAVNVRRFELSGSSRINGIKMDMTGIDQVVPVDTTEIWEVENRAGVPHSFHVHDGRFRIAKFGGGPPPPQLSGPKDTVLVPPGETVRLVTRFSDYTDPDLPYMFHCHFLHHEDMGMMGQFVVVEPGDESVGQRDAGT